MRAFHKQEGVLFQFILQEFLILGSQLKILERLPKELTPPQEAVVLGTLNHLIGSHVDTFRVNWGHKREVIPKLKTLTKLLEQGDTLYNLVVEIEKELISLALNISTLKKALKSLKNTLLSVEESIKQITLFFESDETVLYFYLRKRHLFESAFSKGFIKILFEKNKKQYEETLISHFKKRGFFELLPSIETALNNL